LKRIRKSWKFTFPALPHIPYQEIDQLVSRAPKC
jgi:hypothetical protein